MSIMNPVLIAMAGAPASGKSVFRTQEHYRDNYMPGGAHLHCPDTVMKTMVGFRETANYSPAVAFRMYEMPARELANNLLFQAMERRHNVVYDRSCALDDCFDVFEFAQQNGYIVKMHGMIGRPQYFNKRAIKSEQETKRHIPEENIFECHTGFARNYTAFINGNEKIKPLDEVRLWHSVNGKVLPVSRFTPATGEVIEKQNCYDWFRRAAQQVPSR